MEILGEMNKINKNIPSGFGFYLRRLNKLSSDKKEAKDLLARCKAAKATWVSFMVESEDGYTSSEENTKAYRDVLVAGGVKVWVWTFPGSERAAGVPGSKEAANLALHFRDLLEADGVMLDVEKAYKGKKAALNSLVNTTTDALKSTQFGVGFVSYPIPNFHNDIDWSCLSQCDFGSPMLYDTAKTKELVKKSYVQYTEHNPVWIPSLATYDTESAGTEAVQLKGDLDRVFEGNGDKNIRGAIFWSESTTSKEERVVLADYSDLLFIK